MAAMPVAAARA
uniref:Uncharacterized protein n=1 Tax=Oryza punctata TaxID=4537 RepID=A0A0E0KQ95_ORYPU